MESQENNQIQASAQEPVATPNTNPISTPAPAPAAPDMHGFTSEQLAEMRKFYDNNGGFEKVKARISNPEPIHKIDQTPTQAVDQTPTQAVQPQPQPQPQAYQAPLGSITRDEFVAQEYAQALSRDPAFASISEEIANGAFLKDMAKLNIRLVNQDGSLNDGQVREYLRLKAATVAAKQTQVTPEASNAPTVEYAPYDENNMDMQKAMAILQQDSALRGQGLAGHPNAIQAEEFMKKLLNPQK